MLGQPNGLEGVDKSWRLDSFEDSHILLPEIKVIFLHN